MEAGSWKNRFSTTCEVAATLPYLALGWILIAWIIDGDRFIHLMAGGVFFGLAGGYQIAVSDWKAIDVPVLGNLLFLLTVLFFGGFGFLIASGISDEFGESGSAFFVGVLTLTLIWCLYWGSPITQIVATIASASAGFIGTVMVAVAIGMGMWTDGSPLAALEKLRGHNTRIAAVVWSFAMPIGLIGAWVRWMKQYHALPEDVQKDLTEHTQGQRGMNVVKLIVALLAITASLAGLTALAKTFKVFELISRLL